jgi:SET domain-containing protein
MQKWSVNGLFRMALFALREIHPHEELSYDYNFSLFNPAEGQVFFSFKIYKTLPAYHVCKVHKALSWGYGGIDTMGGQKVNSCLVMVY